MLFYTRCPFNVNKRALAQVLIGSGYAEFDCSMALCKKPDESVKHLVASGSLILVSFISMAVLTLKPLC